MDLWARRLDIVIYAPRVALLHRVRRGLLLPERRRRRTHLAYSRVTKQTSTPTTNTNCTSTPQMDSPFMVGSVVLEVARK